MNENKNRQKIILISDIWGKEKSDWISNYTTILEKHFDIQYYDSCELGNIDKSEPFEVNLHHQFVNGGIEKAIENLLQQEQESFIVLGFSIGGFIAWRAALSGLKTKILFAISSTRLRHETQKPSGIIELFYGENDTYKPDHHWFHQMDLSENIYPNEDHNMYQKKEIAEEICKQMIQLVKEK